MRLALRILLILVVIAGAAVAGGAYWLDRQIAAPGPLAEPSLILIEPGTGLRQIASDLESIGAVSEDWLFIAAVMRAQAERAIKAGEYQLMAQASPEDLVEILVSGETILHPITIPEGLTSAQIVQLLMADPLLSGDITETPIEGSLLPETYLVRRNADRQRLIERMQADKLALLSQIWPDRDDNLPISDQQEAITLASIVEKETAVAAERAKVAGVFINRLNRGMPLQADPTVIYALTGGSGTLGRALTRADWRVDNPYNTYQNAGLPPGPIANPGAASLQAVLNPEQHEYFYFVANGQGGHAFAKTLREHNRNVAAWRRIRRSQ